MVKILKSFSVLKILHNFFFSKFNFKKYFTPKIDFVFQFDSPKNFLLYNHRFLQEKSLTVIVPVMKYF